MRRVLLTFHAFSVEQSPRIRGNGDWQVSVTMFDLPQTGLQLSVENYKVV